MKNPKQVAEKQEETADIMQTERGLRLRPFERSEVALYSEWMHNPDVLGPYVDPEHQTLAELEADFDIDGWRTNRMRRWILTDQEGAIMGFAHCWEFDPYETHVEFGRVLLPRFRGKRLGAPFLSLVIDRVFEETGADRAQSVTSCENIAVQRNWQSCGLAIEARLREYMTLHGRYVDCFLCGVLRREWSERKPRQIKRCEENPCEANPCEENPCEENPCEMKQCEAKPPDPASQSISAGAEDVFVDNNLSERRRLIADIFENSPMFDVALKRVFERELEDTQGHRLIDFSTQDYLGFDFEPDVVNAAIQGTREFGTVVAWCRMVATLEIFNRAEKMVAELVGSESCSIFASTTLLNHGVIPALLGNDGILFLDKSAHATMYEGAKIARDSGAMLVSFPSNDLQRLEELLLQNKSVAKKLIAVDGVNSMTGGYSDLPGLDRLARKYGALIFVDDAHGFGVVGEEPSRSFPYGRRGNGLVKYFGLNYDNILYIGCFSKAYGTFGSFIACSTRMRNFLLSQATPHDLGGAGPASALSALLAGLMLNADDGDRRRNKTWELVQQALAGLRELGFETHNTTGFPIISVRLKAAHLMVEASKLLYEHHILATLAPYPSVKKGDEAIRLTITATNNEKQIEELLSAFAILKGFITQKGCEI